MTMIRIESHSGGPNLRELWVATSRSHFRELWSPTGFLLTTKTPTAKQTFIQYLGLIVLTAGDQIYSIVIQSSFSRLTPFLRPMGFPRYFALVVNALIAMI